MSAVSMTTWEHALIRDSKLAGCLACRVVFRDFAADLEPAEYHHLRPDNKTRHYLGIPLCAPHHRTGPNRYHGAESTFAELFGEDAELFALHREMMIAAGKWPEEADAALAKYLDQAADPLKGLADAFWGEL